MTWKCCHICGAPQERISLDDIATSLDQHILCGTCNAPREDDTPENRSAILAEEISSLKLTIETTLQRVDATLRALFNSTAELTSTLEDCHAKGIEPSPETISRVRAVEERTKANTTTLTQLGKTLNCFEQAVDLATRLSNRNHKH